ncbi:eukaryotic translation elongation factor 1 delta b (guanine nucleotide exchange protein) isoform X2 [Syngnathus scovelli]|uniref:eukaryotic translation elongation factor 1 delta b (guanine nucleotide exchange protein) isoform X2 n=1 Tax=Syngnathus scovelli TaxID=161590 RepID=UPI00210F7BE6|nr:eukaryotic translation elongation factor 1 delta b (guanine nucleotide exchange protein) isoform X2 [Syngnathus scovelli]
MHKPALVLFFPVNRPKMSKETPKCSAAATLDHNKTNSSADALGECRNASGFAWKNGDASSSPESRSSDNDAKSGKRRRGKKCASNSEKVNGKGKTRENCDGRAGLMALHSECADVWFQRSAYERAESLYQCWLANSSESKGSAPSPPNNSSPGQKALPQDELECLRSSIQKASESSAAAQSPDEGYGSQAPTPGATGLQQRALTPTSPHSVNGLPPVLAEMFGEVWLEKPLYDRAEAAFHQNLYAENSSRQSPGCSTSRSGRLPSSVTQAQEGKAEVFHTLHPIQEEEEPAETKRRRQPHLPLGWFLHSDSERVWLDKWRFDAAEMRFHARRGGEALQPNKARRPKMQTSAESATAGPNKMNSVNFLAREKIWLDKSRYDEAERRFFERVGASSQSTPKVADAGANAILQDIARARENIQKSLAGSTCSSSGCGTADQELISRIKSLELENKTLNRVVGDLRASLSKLECRIVVLEKSPMPAMAAPLAPYTNHTGSIAKQQLDNDDDDVDLFGSDDDDDQEAEKLKEQRLKEYAERKAKKPAVIAKSSILLDVKPWDDETDMGELERCVRSVQADGLLWGMSKLVPVGYGINKLQISCVVEDDKVGTDMLEEEITKFEDYVQSVDVAAFNKI